MEDGNESVAKKKDNIVVDTYKTFSLADLTSCMNPASQLYIVPNGHLQFECATNGGLLCTYKL